MTTAGDPFGHRPAMGAELDPFANLSRLAGAVVDRTAAELGRAAGEAGPVDLLAEVETMARRFAIGPLFLVNPADKARAAEVLDVLGAGDVDHRVTLRVSPFVELGTLLVITPEARAAAHDVGLTDDVLANPQHLQEGTE